MRLVSCFALVSALLLSLPVCVEAQETELAGLRAASKQAPNDLAAQRALGRGLLRAGRWHDAQTQYQRVSHLDHGSAESLYDVARVEFAEGDYRGAQAACRPLSRMHDDPRATILADVCDARAQLVWHRASRAFEELAQAQAAAPNDYDVLLALGDAYRLQADVPHGEEAYRHASSVAPTRAEAALGLGRLYLAATRHDDAITALRHAVQLDPADPEACYELGTALGSGDEAKQALQRAVAGRPTWADAQSALGDVLLATNDAAGAQAAYEQALHLSANLASAHLGLGRAKAAAGDLPGAETELRRAIELVSNSPEAARSLGDVLARQGHEDDAIEQYRHAADLDPRDPRALLAAVRLALSLHRDVLAAGFLDRLLEAQPELAPALAEYGDVMRTRGDRNAARDYYQRALRSTHGTLEDRHAVETALASLSSAPPAHH